MVQPVALSAMLLLERPMYRFKKIERNSEALRMCLWPVPSTNVRYSRSAIALDHEIRGFDVCDLISLLYMVMGGLRGVTGFSNNLFWVLLLLEEQILQKTLFLLGSNYFHSHHRLGIPWTVLTTYRSPSEILKME